MTLSNPQMEQSPVQLPAMKLLQDACRYVLGERQNFFAMALLPIVGLSLIGSLALFFYPDPLLAIDPESKAIKLNFVYIPLVLVNTIFYAMFAVAWHRKWLLGESEITIYSALKWDMRKNKFLLRLIQIFAIAFGMMMGLNILLSFMPGTGGFMLSPFGSMLAIAILTLTFSRLSLLLPAAAVDDKMDLKTCWQITQGNSWRLAILAILPPIPLAFIQILAQMFLYQIFDVIDAANGLFAQLIFLLVEQMLNYIGIAIGVSALSMAYIFFKENKTA